MNEKDLLKRKNTFGIIDRKSLGGGEFIKKIKFAANYVFHLLIK